MTDRELYGLLSGIRDELNSVGTASAIEVIDRKIGEVKERLSRGGGASTISIEDRRRCLETIGEIIRLLPSYADLIDRFFS